MKLLSDYKFVDLSSVASVRRIQKIMMITDMMAVTKSSTILLANLCMI